MSGRCAVDLTRLRIDPLALKKVTRQFALDNKLIPVSLSKDRLTVAMANPFELTTLDELQFQTRLYIDTRYAPESKIIAAIRKHTVEYLPGLNEFNKRKVGLMESSR